MTFLLVDCSSPCRRRTTRGPESGPILGRIPVNTHEFLYIVDARCWMIRHEGWGRKLQSLRDIATCHVKMFWTVTRVSSG
jgi:hypothetical protein